MRKFFTYLLVFIIVTTSVASFDIFNTPKTAYAEEELIGGLIEVEQEDSSDIKYFQFENPIKISSSPDVIAVLDEGKEKEVVHLFDANGEFLSTSEFVDPKEIAVCGAYVYVLDYDKNAQSSIPTILKAIEISTGMVHTAMEETAIVSISSHGDFLYLLTGIPTMSVDVIRYDAPSTTLNLDNSFDTENFFDEVLSISTYANTILGLKQTGSPQIFVYNTETNKKTVMSNLPNQSILDYTTDGTSVYLVTPEGIFQSPISENGEFENIMSLSKISNMENIVDPIAMDFDQADSTKAYIVDNKNALAVKRFVKSTKSLVGTNFMIGSISSELGAFNTPTDIQVSKDVMYITDSLNNRIQIHSRTGKMTEFKTKDSDGKLYTPVVAGADFFGNIFVASKDTVYKYSSNFELLYTFDEDFDSINSIYASSVSSEIFIVDNSTLYELNKEGDQFNEVESIGHSNSIEVDMRYNQLISTSSNQVKIFDLFTFDQIETLKVESGYIAQDVFVDFDGSIYVLAHNNDHSFIEKFIFDSEKEEYKSNGKVYFNNLILFEKMIIKEGREEVYLLPKDEHRLFYFENSDFDMLEVANMKSLDIPLDIFDKEPNSDVVIGTVIEGDNRLIYPPNESDKLYPENYVVEWTRKLDENEKVIVAGYTEDEKFAYVIYNNAAGFMDSDAIDVSKQNSDVPFKYAITLHNNSYIYKYPLITVSNLYPIYSIDKLAKDTSLKVIDSASNYISPTGLYWYKVSYTKGEEEIIGYVPRYLVAEDNDLINPEYEFGQINADVLVANVELYADLGHTMLGIQLTDKTKVKIYEESGDFYYIEEVVEDGRGVFGYVHKDNITTSAQTQSTTIALILIAVCIVIVIILLIAKKIISHRKI